jgi:drug/metabolite transporter (DMT)-like permease
MTSDRANLVGSIWMIAAMALFAIEDALLKAAAETLPVSQVLVLFGAGGALIFAALARRQGTPLVPKEVKSRPMLIRAVFEVFGRLFYTLAFVLTPLSSTTVILQATPLVVVGAAATLFGERVDWRRWGAIFLGLVGVVVIIQPGGDSFTPLSILAVLGMLGFAGRDLASRAAPASLGTNILGLYGFFALIAAGALFAIYEDEAFVTVGISTGLIMAAACGVGVIAYTALMRAMRTGEVSAVTPFRYSRLLFGLGLGVFVFGESLTAPMIWGSLLIVASGLFILWRGQKT